MELPGRFDIRIAGTIFSIVQQAVNNARRHACANNVWIELATTPDTLIVEVRDDGRGFDVAAVAQDYEKRGSFGMLNMRERARLVDGNFTIQSNTEPPNRGTTITLRVPLPAPTDFEMRPTPASEDDE